MVPLNEQIAGSDLGVVDRLLDSVHVVARDPGRSHQLDHAVCCLTSNPIFHNSVDITAIVIAMLEVVVPRVLDHVLAADCACQRCPHRLIAAHDHDPTPRGLEETPRHECDVAEPTPGHPNLAIA